jgi:hypothetical protein
VKEKIEKLFGKSLLANDDWLLKNFVYEGFFDGGVDQESNSVTSVGLMDELIKCYLHDIVYDTMAEIQFESGPVQDGNRSDYFINLLNLIF